MFFRSHGGIDRRKRAVSLQYKSEVELQNMKEVLNQFMVSETRLTITDEKKMITRGRIIKKMTLSQEDGQLYYKLWMPSLDFVNETYVINKEIKDMANAKSLNPAEVKEIANKL